MEIKEILAQLIGLCAVVFFISSIQLKEKTKILFFQLVANIFYFIQYILLGVYVAAFMNLLTIWRCFVFKKYDEQNKTIPLKYLIIFVSLIIVFGIFNYNGILSIIPPVITIIYGISSYQKNTEIIRLTFLLCAFIWIFYNFSVGAYTALIGNGFEVISGVIALIRFRKNK